MKEDKILNSLTYEEFIHNLKNNLHDKDYSLEELQLLIKKYYELGSDISFDWDKILSQYKEKYIYSGINNQSKEEMINNEGLAITYDYLLDSKNNKMENIYLILKLHQLLYSNMSGISFGGNFRNTTAFLNDSGADLLPYEFIPYEVSKLNQEYIDIIELGKNISHGEELVTYLDKVIELTYRIVRIHPFLDGNKRVSRTLTNYLFYLGGIKPVFVTKDEKKTYNESLELAMTLNDDYEFKKYYYKKILESLYLFDFKKEKTHKK